MDDRKVKGLEHRTFKSKGFRTSIRIGRPIEGIFGWMKTVGDFRKSRHPERVRAQISAYFKAGPCNPLCIAEAVAVHWPKFGMKRGSVR